MQSEKIDQLAKSIAEAKPFIGDVRRALFTGAPTHDMWVRDITAEMEVKGYLSSSSEEKISQQQPSAAGV